MWTIAPTRFPLSCSSAGATAARAHSEPVGSCLCRFGLRRGGFFTGQFLLNRANTFSRVHYGFAHTVVTGPIAINSGHGAASCAIIVRVPENPVGAILH